MQPLPEQARKRPRRSPRLHSPIDLLAKVELQLVLQCLDADSRLKAARCSRRLMRAADDPFAWVGTPPFSVSSRKQAQPGTVISRSLLRHAPIELLLNSDPTMELEVWLIPRLHGLIVFAWQKYLFPSLLPLPALRGLQTLRLYFSPTVAVLQRLPTLPQLHTLEIHPHLPEDDCSWLPAMPALTDLNTRLPSFSSEAHAAIGQCARLQSLRLLVTGFMPDSFAPFCATPAMGQLRHLEFQFLAMGCDMLSADEWRAGWSALAQLESLCLKEVQSVDQLLPHLAQAPALRTLTIFLRPSPDPQPSIYPSTAALRQLLAAAPQLQVRLSMAATPEQ